MTSYTLQTKENLDRSQQRRNWYLKTLSKAQIYRMVQDLRKQGFNLGPTSKLNKDQLRYLLLEFEFGQKRSNDIKITENSNTSTRYENK
ncbi:MAG: hypothetical protein ACFFB3_12425 [Candidatus Hodarchaeota archaeon]